MDTTTGPEETLGDEGEWLVQLAYPNVEGDITDNLARDSVVSPGNVELKHWVHQAGAGAPVLQGEAFFHGEKERGVVHNVNAASQGTLPMAGIEVMVRALEKLGWKPSRTPDHAAATHASSEGADISRGTACSPS